MDLEARGWEAVYAERDPDDGHRVDLRRGHNSHGVATVTIDSPDTVEIDDALSFEVEADGRVRLWVHIADPSALIPLHSALEQEARGRASTLYHPTQVPVRP